MLAKLSVDQTLMKAKSHANRGEIEEAKRLYQSILLNFSKNKRAQQGLSDLNKFNRITTTQDPPQEIINQLFNLYKQGQFSLAVEQAQILTKQYPDNFMFWNILGASAAQVDMTDEAITAFKKVISIKPEYPDAYINMGLLLHNQGNSEKAVELLKKAVLLQPDHEIAYNNLGLSLQGITKLDEAIEAYKKAISLKPNYAIAYNNMGNVLQDQGKLDDAIDAYKKSVSLKPDYAVAYNNIGFTLNKKEIFGKSISSYKKAIALKPDYAEAYNNMGNALNHQDKIEEAINAYKKAISINPEYADAYSNMGAALIDLGDLDQAIQMCNKAIILKPDYPYSYYNVGNALKDQGMLDESIEAYKKALLLNSNYVGAHFNISLSLLQSGRIKEGLEEYEWRHKTKQGLTRYRHFPQPKWDGKTSLKDKTILLWCEQGIGDTMNWSSCLNLVTDCSKHVILECQEKLVPLLSRSFPNVEVKAQDRSLDADRDDFDLHLPMGSLYKHFIDTIMDNGMASSYLVANPDRVKFWKDRLHSVGKGPYIGVCWKSSVKSAYRQQHYPSMSEWAPVFKVPDVTFINLQYKDYEDDIAQVQDELGVTIHNLDDIDQYGDIDEVAALCGALDMVVSTKATPPMISAGVGTPTKIANWRQSNYNTILTNPQSTSLDMIHRDTWETWDKVFKSIADDILKLKN